MSTDQRSTPSTVRSDPWTALISTIAVLALLLASTAVVVTWADHEGGSAAATGGTKAVDVTLAEFSITPATLTVAPGTTLELTVTNKGTMAHDLKLNGTEGTEMLAPGDTETVSFTVDQSSEAWCTVPGHKEAGMVMKIDVAGSAPAAASTASAASGKPEIDPNATPSDGWTPRDPALQPVEGGTEHKVTLHATEKPLEIAPGITQEMWTFNDQVPAPTLHGKVGDVFTVTLVNDGKVGHSLDFHASQTAMDTNMRTIEPGQSLVYRFRAEHSGIWMYHCGTQPVLHHIGNGMYGAVVIDPPDLAPVDKEYVFVQSDLYLSPDGKAAGLDQMLADDWDIVAFNGYYNQYKFAPITSAKPGERVRIWILDAGPSENSAFHLVGTQWDTVFKEGAYLLRKDNPEMGGSQTLDLQPSQGGFVEFAFAEDGTYAMVTHKFSSASKGAVAVWKVGNVPEAPAASSSGGH